MAITEILAVLKDPHYEEDRIKKNYTPETCKHLRIAHDPNDIELDKRHPNDPPMRWICANCGVPLVPMPKQELPEIIKKKLQYK